MRNNIAPIISLRKLFFYIFLVSSAAVILSGCSAGQKGLLTITPEQYFYSAKESIETIDERNYEVRDLDEIIRVLENAEKDAKKSDIIDRSRMYLALAHVLKARKLYQNSLMKGEYIANRAEPFFVINTKEVKETLRTAKKWLRQCDANFKTNSVRADLEYVKGMFHSMKMMTRHSQDKKESLDDSVDSLRRCIGVAPDYKSDFKLFGREQTNREVRFKLIETLAMAGHQVDAYGLLSEFSFAPISPVSGATAYKDFAWHHMQGFVLAMMGRYEDAAKILEQFKIVAPQDYPQVDEALWILEGVYDRMSELTDDQKFSMEARIVAALQKKLKGPYAKEQYSTSAHLFPRLLPGDEQLFEAVMDFYSGRFPEAFSKISILEHKGIMNSTNRIYARLLLIEASLYSQTRVSDDYLETLLQIAMEKNLSPLQKERAGYLLARYIMDDDQKFDTTLVNHDGQSFTRSITARPWQIKLDHRRGAVKKAQKPVIERTGTEEDNQGAEREPGELKAEIYANRPEDWVVSANLYIFSLPELNMLTEGRVVGREQEGEGWIFKDNAIDKLVRRRNYLAVFEYDNSDSEKSIQGSIFQP